MIGSEAPTAAEIRRYLEVVNKLERFEAEQRYLRKYGIDVGARPVPAYKKVSEWLLALSKKDET